MKRILALFGLFAFAALGCFAPAARADVLIPEPSESEPSAPVVVPITPETPVSGETTIDNVVWEYSTLAGEATVTHVHSAYASWVLPAGDLVVPATLGDCPVTAIDGNIFVYASDLTSVTFPDSLELLTSGNFVNCAALERVVFGTGLNRLEGNVFVNCPNLTQVVIPEGNETYAAAGTTLYSKDGTTLVLYFGQESIVDIPATVTAIGEGAFAGRSTLTHVNFPEGLTSIGVRAFQATGLEQVEIPEGVISIGRYAFSECRRLQSFRLGLNSPLKSIEDGLVSGCSQLRNFYLPISTSCRIASIGESAFSGCITLMDFSVPHTVETVGAYAFQGCSQLRTFTVGHSVTSIGFGAFGACDSLAFFSCGDNQNPVYEEIGGALYFRTDAPEKTLAFYPPGRSTLYFTDWSSNPVNVIAIAKGACTMCNLLTDVTIPSTVRSIGESAFEACSALARLKVPDGPESIGPQAFAMCMFLMDVEIAGTVKTIGQTAFVHDFLPPDDGSVGRLVLHEGIETIEEGAFERCMRIGSLTLPNSLTTLGEYAFESCQGLRSIVVGDGLTTIPERAFSCDWGYRLRSLTLGANVQTIGESAFAGCEQVEALVIPEGVTSIGPGAFQNCRGLTALRLPDSLTAIGDSAFVECSALKSLAVPPQVTAIGEDAFAYSSLASIYLPATLKGALDLDAVFTDLGLGSMSEEELAEVVTWYGDSAAIQYATVTFDPTESVALGPWSVEVLDYLGTLPVLAAINSDGPKAFDGWWTAPDGGDQVFDGARVDGDTTLYAHWAEAPFVFGGETRWQSAEDDAFPGERVWRCGSDLEAGQRATATAYISSNVPLVLVFSWKKIDDWGGGKLTLSVNGEIRAKYPSGSSDWETVECELPEAGESYEITVTYTNTNGQGGYALLSGTDFQAAEAHTVTFDQNIAFGMTTRRTVLRRVGKQPLLKPSYTSTGLALFTGWWTEPEGGVRVTENTAVSEDVTYYAHWTPSPFSSTGGDGFWYVDEDGALRTSPIEQGQTVWAEAALAGARNRASFDWKANGYWDDTLEFAIDGERADVYYGSSYARYTSVSRELEGPHTVRWTFTRVEADYDEDDYENCAWMANLQAGTIYSVTFDYNDGSGESETRECAGSPGELPGALTRDYLAFDGWWTLPEGGERVTADTRLYADARFYAHWVESPFRFDYDSWIPLGDGVWRSPELGAYSAASAYKDVNGPCNVSFKWRLVEPAFQANAQFRDADYNTLAELNVEDDWSEVSCDLEGSGFQTVQWEFYAGWSGSAANRVEIKDLAVSALPTYTVVFQPNDAGENAVTARDVVQGGAVGELPVLWRDGYAQAGWWTAPEGGRRLTPDTLVTGNAEWYAHWVESPFTFGGDAPWTQDADGSWRTGKIGYGQDSDAYLSVNGPCTVSFEWKSSVYYSGAYFRLYVDGMSKTWLDRSEEVWQSYTVTLEEEGSHVLDFNFYKNTSTSAGEDCFWLRNVKVGAIGGGAPSIEGDPDAEISGNAESGYTVKPSEGKTEVEVTIPADVEPEQVVVEVSRSVERVKPNGAQIKLVHQGEDLTPYVKFPEPDEDGYVAMDEAEVQESVVEELLDANQGAQVNLDPASPTLTTPATKPGLKYTLVKGSALGAMTPGESKTGDGTPWSPDLAIPGEKKSGFWRIRVELPEP